MRDSEIVFADGRVVPVSELTPVEIGRTLDAINRGTIMPAPDENRTLDDLRERLLVELVAREIAA